MKALESIPNGLTIARILLCVPLLLVRPFSAAFFAVYLLCGLTDVLDGWLARKMNAATAFGAKLDSLADLVFFAALLLIFALNLSLPLWAVAWVLAILLVKLAAFLVGYKRYHKLFSLHTYANKAAGILVFCTPMLYLFFGVTVAAVAGCAAASLAAIEELAINTTSKELQLDIKSLFSKPLVWK